MDSTTTLYNLHIAAFVVHFASSILSFFFHIEKAQANVLVPLHTYATNEYTVTSSNVLFTLSPLVLVSINEILTCLSHGIALYWLRGTSLKEVVTNAQIRLRRSLSKDEEQNIVLKAVNRREFSRRGYEYMLTAGILQCALVLGVGHAYLHDLLFLLMINVVIQLLGISIDMTKESDRKGTSKSMAIFWNYVMAFTLLCVEIVYVFIHCFSIEKPDSFDTSFFYAMGFIYAILYLMFGVVKLLIEDDEKANQMYVALSVTTKVILSWVLIGNTHYGFVELFDAPYPAGVQSEVDWPALMWSVIVVFGVLLTGLTFYIMRETRLEYTRVESSRADLKDV